MARKKSQKPEVGDIVYIWQWVHPRKKPARKVLARWVIYQIDRPRSAHPWYHLRKLTGKPDYRGFWKVSTGTKGPLISEAEAKLLMALKGI